MFNSYVFTLVTIVYNCLGRRCRSRDVCLPTYPPLQGYIDLLWLLSECLLLSQMFKCSLLLLLMFLAYLTWPWPCYRGRLCSPHCKKMCNLPRDDFVVPFSVSNTTLISIYVIRYIIHTVKPVQYFVKPQKRTIFNHALNMVRLVSISAIEVLVNFKRYVLNPPFVNHCRSDWLLPCLTIDHFLTFL